MDRLGGWHVTDGHSAHRVGGAAMTEHLPECLMNLAYAVRVCICTELRACEQRVLNEYRQQDLAAIDALRKE